ncbi:hypothetical protein Aperf_G00000014290 [Anoplocephala perfoliata]
MIDDCRMIAKTVGFWPSAIRMEVDEPQSISACLTYTLAFRYIFKVLDLNSSACRSEKEMASQYSEVTISWQVSTGVYRLRLSHRVYSNVYGKKGLLHEDLPSSEAVVCNHPLRKITFLFQFIMTSFSSFFDDNWSFWVAVGKLFQQQWVQWVVGELYLSLLIHAIPIPIQISRLKSLISSILKEPFLQRMCDSQLAHLSESLIHSPDIEDCNRDYPIESPQIEGFPRSLGRLYGGF